MRHLFGGEFDGFEGLDFDGFSSSDEEFACPGYLRKYMDRDTVHMTVSDLFSCSDDYYESETDESVNEKKVSASTVCWLLTPVVFRDMGLKTELLVSSSDYKKRSLGAIYSVAPIDIKEASGSFRSMTQNYFYGLLDALYYKASSFDEGKSVVRDILTLLGLDYPLERIEREDVVLYHTTYLPYTKVLYLLGLFDPNDFRYQNGNNQYLKHVPKPTLWDVKEFLELEASFVVSNFYRGFFVMKEDPSNRRWVDLYDEALNHIDLVDTLSIKVPRIYTRNKQKELWVLNTHDFFCSVLKKKIIVLSEEIPVGLREEFISFFLPEEIQNVISPMAVYRPWKKIE